MAGSKPVSGYTSAHKEGFANIARWIALDRDSETSIYRRFNQLSARNLLYLQCELLALEKKLERLDQNDLDSDDMGLKDEARTWETFMERYENGNQEAKLRKELIADLRARMKEYHEALLLQSEIVKLKRPNKRVLEAYRHWFQKPYPVLGGAAKETLDDSDDLVALNTLPEGDYLSMLLRRHWPATEEVSRDGLYHIGRFKETSITIAVAFISILVASFLLIGSIVGLYFATDDALKLGLVAGFTAVFALSVGLMTNARRAEIFAATAAYAAVLVVFVSGNISNSWPES
ncbi:hypothetical protein BDW59DRAFT_178782 [Aspergillus cavernicola]|uniref:DUF6594 domain-containing protein n=1 Tax=Aspergillus cavernicola TaxID=176166 RepID=A0ABR4J3H3_9EURO